MTNAGLQASTAFTAIDEFGQQREGHIAAERALTVYLDKKEIVTLMTLGTQPELLVLGWLRNQRLLPEISQIKAIQVDWETESAVITTHNGVEDLDRKMGRRTVTTGCGQGTVFGSLMDDIDKIKLPKVQIHQSTCTNFFTPSVNITKSTSVQALYMAAHCARTIACCTSLRMSDGTMPLMR